MCPFRLSITNKDWARGSSLEEVIFESALSLRTMIQGGRVDLSGNYEIKVIDADCELDLLSLRTRE
jgi:hypothetical protein